MKQIEKNCEDCCPECNSTDINWQGSELIDTSVIYSGRCSSCNTDFSEEYKLVYNITVYGK